MSFKLTVISFVDSKENSWIGSLKLQIGVSIKDIILRTFYLLNTTNFAMNEP